MKYKISIIIPVYNVEKYLERCIASIVEQNNHSIEIILVDDGSKDSSSVLCDEYAKKYEYISTFHKTNGGASSARNYGIKRANGEYIWFIDSDDKIVNGSIDNIIQIINNKKTDIIICNSKIVDENGRIEDECLYSINRGKYNSKEFMTVLKNNPKSVIFAPQYYIVRREFLLENDIYFYEGIIHEDELWIPQLLIKAKNIFYSNLNIYYHYMWKGSVMHSTRLEKSGLSCYIVSMNLLKIFDESKRDDLKFLRDKNANIFLQAVWKIPNFLDDKSKIHRKMPLKNSYYFKTKIKAIIYFLSPSIYLFIHNKRRGGH